MEDTLTCPICNNKLRNLYLIDFQIERTCVGINHTLQFIVKNKQVLFLKTSLESNYSKFIDIDFVDKKCKIIMLKMSKPFYIEIPKLLEPDFPLLLSLKEKVSLYVTFS